MYEPSQIATAYGTRALQATDQTKAVRVAVIDLGGGYLDSDILAAAKCLNCNELASCWWWHPLQSTPGSVRARGQSDVTTSYVKGDGAAVVNLQRDLHGPVTLQIWGSRKIVAFRRAAKLPA